MKTSQLVTKTRVAVVALLILIGTIAVIFAQQNFSGPGMNVGDLRKQITLEKGANTCFAYADAWGREWRGDTVSNKFFATRVSYTGGADRDRCR